MPRVSLHAELIGVVEQPLHIGGVEFFVVHITEVRPDARQVEICPVLLCSVIDPIQITDPLRLNQRTDGPSADAQGAALHSGPLRLQSGAIAAGGLEWMKAGNGVWHDGGAAPGAPMRFYQLWVALPASEENSPPESQYIPPEAVQEDGSVRVILGRYGRASSPIRASAGINYFHVGLKDGEKWRYTPPAGHSVAWLSVDEGRLRSSEAIHAGQLAVFEETGGAIELQADGVTSFVIGSAIKHPHPLILGRYSVHTNAAALAQGEGEIRRIGERLRAEGRL